MKPTNVLPRKREAIMALFGTWYRHVKQRLVAFIEFNRTHPYFKFLMTFDAIFSVALVIGGIAIFSQTLGRSHKDFLKLYGAVSMTAEELTNVLKNQGIGAYWLGPISGSEYTIVKSADGVVVITYLSNGKGILDHQQKNLIFQTEADSYKKEALVSSENRGTNEFDVTVTGNTYSYDRLDPDHMVVKIKGNKSHVRVYYPTSRDAIRMEIDADALQKVS